MHLNFFPPFRKQTIIPRSQLPLFPGVTSSKACNQRERERERERERSAYLYILMATPGAKSWRTSFLTLRDEILVSPPHPDSAAILNLLQNLLSQSDILALAAPDLPSHEVTSDVMLLVELTPYIPESNETTDTFFRICRLIHDVSCRFRLEINSSSWVILMTFLENIMRLFCCKSDIMGMNTYYTGEPKIMIEILQILSHIVSGYGGNWSQSESTQLVKLLLHIISCSHAEALFSLHSSDNQRPATSNGARCGNIWEAQTLSFSMIGDELSRVGSSVSVDIWQSTLEVLRKVLDVLALKNQLVEDSVMSRFYTSMLRCLHLVLSDPKGSLSEHVAGIVASLRVFFMYGLTNKSSAPACASSKAKELSSPTLNLTVEDSRKSNLGPYRPPHLRKSGRMRKCGNASEHGSSGVCVTTSDSDQSDSDGSVKHLDLYQSSKARIAAILCIQDLCQVDPKSLTAQWTMLLPTTDVLQPRKFEATLMTCLLFDPVIKTRMASASSLAAMLDGPSSIFLQVAEYKETTKRGSFTTLSASLGQILMQLHTGLLYSIHNESHSGLLTSLFKVLLLLISASPYTRMPGELLSATIFSLQTRILDLLALDHTTLLAAALSCLGAALSTSPPSLQVTEMLQEEIRIGVVEAQGKSRVLSTIFQILQSGSHPSISFEGLQVLRAVAHHYPSLMFDCWDQVSCIIYVFLQTDSLDGPSCELPARPWRGDIASILRAATERCVLAAIRVLDECLRAVSGFKGLEDHLEDRIHDNPFISDLPRRFKVLSAPSYELSGPEVTNINPSACESGSKHWHEAIEKHLALGILHSSPMVRAASITCFTGLGSSVFFSLTKEKQDFIISSSVNAALNDDVPSVRSAACRAIGVIACFPQIYCSAEILDEFIRAAEINTRDALVSVRITASWAVANICDSLRRRASDVLPDKSLPDSSVDSCSVSLLADCALHLTKDGDKIKANAVRALGNLSRFVGFASHSTVHNGSTGEMGSYSTCCTDFKRSNKSYKSSHGLPISSNDSKSAFVGDPHWLERMVQAFVSCVTTGNAKVRWNVCHALGNLFLNETLRLQDMAWAPSVYSILLLLLRDSTNFKIRIQAAVALAVPASTLDYGNSYSDVLQGLVHVLETSRSSQDFSPSTSKYRSTLEEQLTLTTLHVLGLASCDDHQPLRDFLVKKSTFLEEWLKSTLPLLVDTESENQKDKAQCSMEKKAVISGAVKSLIQIYECGNHHSIAQRFENLSKLS